MTEENKNEISDEELIEFYKKHESRITTLTTKTKEELEEEIKEKIKNVVSRKDPKISILPSDELKTKLQPILNDKIEGFIYFIQSTEKPRRIKIGYSQDPKNRFNSLNSGSPLKLRLILTIKGNKDLEYELHHIFREFRIKGEWFYPAPELLQYIIDLIKE